MTAREGNEAEYVRRHAAVWPEVLSELKAAGVRNYSIFMDGSDLFAYFEVDDFADFVRATAAGPASRRWAEYMTEVVTAERDPSTGWFVVMDEVFRLD